MAEIHSLVPKLNGAPLSRMPRVDGLITSSYAIVPCQIEHVYALARTMRDADRREIENLGFGVKKALYRAFRNSVMCKAALIHGEVAAVWGLAVALRENVSPLSDLGVPWLHTSALVEQVPFSFVRVGKRELAAMRQLRPKLESFVAADYKEAIKFLKILGFTVDKAEPLGLNGSLYCRFHMGF
jgi:hypothetical protein